MMLMVIMIVGWWCCQVATKWVLIHLRGAQDVQTETLERIQCRRLVMRELLSLFASRFRLIEFN